MPGSDFFDRLRIVGNPVADPAAQVRVGGARFTVLAPRLIRLEWSATGEFEDRGTFAFPNRRAEVPAFASWAQDGAAVVDTGALVLRHSPDGRALHAGNTSIELTEPPRTRWRPGDRDEHNLGGARRTVDRCRGEAALEQGLVSRSGWALFDDSASVLFTRDGRWIEPRPEHENLQDWYFFGYGHDYPAALSEYTRFGGSVPFLPRWALGTWWSRYWPYRDSDVRALVAEFRDRDVPLDVFVLDMDWHLPDSWTGYTWNRDLLGEPRSFLRWLHEQGVHTTLNLHPALGVQPFEEAYPAFARAMGVDPDSAVTVPFRIADRDFVRHYFELLHHPLEDDGVDFWWIDWQQGRSSELPGLDPLPWLNHLHTTDLARHRDRRPLVLSRWGGLGSHRYPIGFSGDSFALWEALQFQPRYTAAGANVGFGWWSHDIGGHVGADDPELYVRWVQFGALSPILRLHSVNHPDSERLPWRFGPDVLALARAAFRMRYALLPYLYTAARVAADSGIAAIRPTAWLAPERDGAYLARYQYLLGDALLVAPVVHPAEPSSGLATVDVWLPDGDWLERGTGEFVTGPRWLRVVADLGQVPQFVRPGSVLPLAEVGPTTSAQPDDHTILSVFPGRNGSALIYRDDGTTAEYLTGRFSWTAVSLSSADPSECTLSVQPAEGEPPRDPQRYTVRFEHTHAPAEVRVDGQPHDQWWYDPDAAVTVVDVPHRSGAQALTVNVATTGEPLAAYGEQRTAALRAADLRRLLGDDTLPDSALDAAVRGLPSDHPSRAAAIARIGGPLIHVYSYTAPDEAISVLGHVVVGSAEAGPARVGATWTRRHGTRIETLVSDAVELRPAMDAAVLAAPFRYDGALVPTAWSVEVTVSWDGLTLTEQHDSAVLIPALPSWRVTFRSAADRASPERLLADLARSAPEFEWARWEADPGSVDFPNLAEPYTLLFGKGAPLAPEAAPVAYAATAVVVAEDRDLSFGYQAGGAVDVYLDGEPVPSDSTGAGPVPFYTLRPWLRRTPPVRVAAGVHTLLFVCPRAELPLYNWYLNVRAVDPQTGAIAIDVCGAAPEPDLLRPQ